MMTTKTKRKRPRNLGRRLLIYLVVLAILAVFFVWQQESFDTQTVQVSSRSLPLEFAGLRIVHLSDIHGKQFGEGNGRLLNKVAEMEPDLIVVTGDLIDRAEQVEGMVAPLAKGLAGIAPTYYVTGNHEWAVKRVTELKELLRECGVRVLSNEYEIWERGGTTFAVAGVDDPSGPSTQKTAIQLRSEIEADYTILLSHRDTVDKYESWGYDLVFCGHGHGGVFRIPIWDQGLLSTTREFFPEYDGGLYQWENGGACFVSRGLGSNTVPIYAFRLFNRPDLPLIILQSGE